MRSRSKLTRSTTSAPCALSASSARPTVAGTRRLTRGEIALLAVVFVSLRLLLTAALATETASPTPTETPLPATGAVVVEVFDDGTAQPLTGATIVVTNANGSATASTDSNGRYTVQALVADDYVVELTKTGYTRSIRRVTVANQAAQAIHDARLTQLGTPVVIGTNGGTVAAPYRVPGSVPGAGIPAELTIASGTLSQPASLQLTVVSPQGLVAPLPLGWSVLLGIDVVAAPGSQLPSAAVRVPLSLLSAAASLPIVVAVWDPTTHQWLGGPAATVVGDHLEVSVQLLDCQQSTVACARQLALVVADALPAAPATAVEGAALQGVSALLLPGDSALVVPDPPAILAGTNGRALVVTQVHSASPLPSGTRLQAKLRETYDLRNGQRTLGTSSRQDLIGYQISPVAGGLPGSPANTLGAYFSLTPSRTFAPTDLAQGQVAIDIGLPQTMENVTVVDSSGGDVPGSGGVRLIVPPNATTGTAIVRLQPVPPTSLPAGAGSRPDFVGALQIDLTSGSLDPTSTYRLGFATTPPDGQRYAVARLESDGRLVLAALGHSDSGLLVVEACPSGLGFCLQGIAGTGTYAVFGIPADAVLVSGTVADSTHVRSGLVVASDRVAIVSVTRTDGRYVLPAAVGVTSVLSVHDTANDLGASVSVTPPTVSVLTVDLELVPTPPEVIDITPPNHGSNVAVDAGITITFSKAIAPASITATSVRVGVSGAGGQVAVRTSLSSDGTQLLLTPSTPLGANTLYTVALTSGIMDSHANRLAGAAAGGLTVFRSDFTTAAVFKADALPPNTLRVSLPEDNAHHAVSPDTPGQVFICGGAQLALAGSFVDVTNARTGFLKSVRASAPDPANPAQTISYSDECDALYPGRCDTSQVGSFCVVLGHFAPNGTLSYGSLAGDKINVQVVDVLHNTVTLDAGGMRDERTGAAVIDSHGGVVIFPADPSYQAFIPDGAFTAPTIVQLTPIEANPTIAGKLDLLDPNHPELAPLTDPAMTNDAALIGAIRVTLDPPNRVAQKPFDVSVPYLDPPSGAAQGQYMAAMVIPFQGDHALTMIDTANFDAQHQLIVTDPGIFPGLTFGGTFGLYRWLECVAYLVGWVDTTNHANDGYIVAPPLGNGTLVVPVDETSAPKFQVPVPCNAPVTLQLFDNAGTLVATNTCASCGVGANGIINLPGSVSEPNKYPNVDAATSTLKNGAVAVSPAQRIQLTFDESMDPKSMRDHVELRVCGPSEGSDGDPDTQDCDTGPLVDGHPELTTDGRIVVFVPDVRLHYGLRYQLKIHDMKSAAGRPMLHPFVATFSTNLPRIVAHVRDVNSQTRLDAQDVTALDPNPPDLDADTRVLAVAEGDAYRLDAQGGVLLYDVTDPRTLAAPILAQATAGIDRALLYTTDGPLTIRSTNPNGGADDHPYTGPFLISVDGPGGPQRYGMWRVMQVSGTSAAPTLTLLASRYVNLSEQAMDRLSGLDAVLQPPTGFTDLSHFFGAVPIDVGVPIDVASFGVQRTFIANLPFIGVQAIQLQPQLSTAADQLQVHGTYRDTSNAREAVPIRAVATLPDTQASRALVISAAQELNDNTLLLLDADLHLKDKYLLANSGRPLAVVGLKQWTVRLADVTDGDQVRAQTAPRDLAVAMTQDSGLRVVSVDAAKGTFDLTQILDGEGKLAGEGLSALGAAADPARQLLYVAAGQSGLAIFDLLKPGGSIDTVDQLGNHTADRVDDRLLGTVPLPDPWPPQPRGTHAVASAWRATHYEDADGRSFVAVATQGSGVYLLADPAPLQVEKVHFEHCANGIDNDVIGCEDQTLGAVADFVGTTYSLHYQSDRTPGGNTVLIPVCGADVPNGVDHFQVTVRVAGRELTKRVTPAANKQLLFAWDGIDADGNYALGSQWATIEVADVYRVGGVDYLWHPRIWGGTLGTWDTRAQGLGGWSLNVLHYYDPKEQVLYLGDGSRRSGALLGVVKEHDDELLIASSDGLAVYAFDRDSGRHLRTLNALNQHVLYSFAYAEDGTLETVTDPDGNSTSLAGGQLHAPFNVNASAAVGPNDYWTTVGSPALALTYSPPPNDPFVELPPNGVPPEGTFGAGLLTVLTDARAKTWHYAYSARGQLLADDDPGAGTITAARSAGSSLTPPSGTQAVESFTVSLNTAGNKNFKHEVLKLDDGTEQRKITVPDGAATKETTITLKSDLSATATYPGGTSSSQFVPGEQASVDATLPAHLGTMVATHQVSRTDPFDLLSTATATDTVNRNGAITTTVASASTVTTTTPGGRTIPTTLDDKGRPQTIRPPGLPLITITYGDDGKVASVEQGGRTTTYGYDRAFVSNVTGPLGSTALPRDATGWVTKATAPGQEFNFTPDANGNVTGTTSPQAGSYAENATYSEVELPTSFNLPAGAVNVSYTADRDGASGTSPWGNLTFDAKGRLTDVGTTHYGLDDDGYLTQMTSPDGTITLTNSGPVPNKIEWSGSVTGAVTVGRNATFQATSIQVGSGPAVNLTVDLDGVLTQAGALAMTRTDAGVLTDSTLANTTDHYERNPLGEPTHYEAKAGGTVMYSADYSRDAGGRVTTVVETIRNPQTGGLETRTLEYGYTSELRLGSVKENGVLISQYSYDGNGNVKKSLPAGRPTPQVPATRTYTPTGTQTTTGTPTPTPTPTNTTTGTTTTTATATPTLATAPFARGGRIVIDASFTTDNCFDTATVQDPSGTLHEYHYTCAADGSLASKTDAFTGESTTYSYDAYGNLRSVGLPDGRTLNYDIDAANRRVGKKVCVNGQCTRVQAFLYLGIAPVAELDAGGQVRRTFVYGSKGNVPDYIQDGSTRYRIVSDHLGSVRLVVDASSGAIMQRLDYDESGSVTYDSNPGFQPFGYAGGLYDTDTDLVRFGARDFDAETGRWTTRDPIGFDGGDGNVYGYAGNDPVNRVDPSGLEAWESIDSDGWREVLGFWWEWVSGGGPARRPFGPDSARTKDIIRAPGTAAAREFFYRDNREACLRGAGFRQKKAYQTTFGLAGLRDAGWNPTRQFVGSYQISMTPIESGPRSLKFTAVNDTTVSSFLYHIWGTSLLNHERSTVGYFGTTRQVFEWEEPLSCR